ncbi:expressed unknown protein [Seminavis robusta]|uniref:Uncharacterized protein n=1 Tax=Seminavis robusta TaxID=568900 RepID=A0A9N8DNS9_9STRA|nr:expressed unknown protein [Seminavis robusta]|eukprot:Sro232_g094030.1 n/a (420) ;mRNA; r:74536-76022
MIKKKEFLVVVWVGFCLVLSLQLFLNSKVSHEKEANLPAKLVSFKSHGRANEIKELQLLTCQDDQDGPCCASWQTNMDDWWLHHPDWYVSQETNNQFCFSRIQDNEKAAFFRKVHDNQWNHNNSTCEHVILANQTNSGYAASINQIVYGFQFASDRGLPFQITKHRPQMTWMFAPKNESSWAYCESQDMNCYYLPLSDCKPVIGGESKYSATIPQTQQANTEFQWLRLYAVRPKQQVRRKVFELITQVQGLPPLPWNINCTAMHIRRGDSGFVKIPWRRYAAVQEYIDKGKVQPGETIVLLCDDASTIEEVQTHHGETYNWIYLNRTRFRGTEGGFNKHSILAEAKMAAQCQKLVVGTSGFVTVIKDAMQLAGQNYKQFLVKTRVTKDDVKSVKKLDPKVRVDQMLNEIEDKYKSQKTG